MSDHTMTQTLEEQGDRAWKQADYVKAQQYYEQLLAIQQQEIDLNHSEIARTLGKLGDIAHTRALTSEDYHSAETLYQQAYDMYVLAFGREHAATIRSLLDLAGIKEELGEVVQAAQWYEDAYALATQALSLDTLDLAFVYGNVARFLRTQKAYVRAELLFQQALTIHRQYPESSGLATTLNNFAYLALEQGDYEHAEERLRHAINTWNVVYGRDHPGMATSFKNLARCYREQGNAALAEVLCQRALTINEQKLGRDHPDTLATRNELVLAQAG